MNSKNLALKVSVDASPKDAMEKISHVNLWWAKNFAGSAAKLNDTFSVRFGETFVDFEISELVPNEKTVWKVTDCNLHWLKNKKEWNGTEAVFEISEKKKSTQIDFTHKGLVPGMECYENCEEGWTHHITRSLVQLINNGKGMPE